MSKVSNEILIVKDDDGYIVSGKCCICGGQFENYGNDPYPLCDRNDYVSRCCNKCNEKVILARIALMKNTNPANT